MEVSDYMKSDNFEKDERIKKETSRLNRTFNKIEPQAKKAVHSLITKAAFMSVTLDALQDTMNEDGVVSEYQNGENQWGTKKSPEVEIYNTMIKNYSAVIKQLTDLLPKAVPEPESDELEDFISEKD